MRWCSRCGRPLVDEAYHNIIEAGTAPPPIAGWYQGHPVYNVPDDWEPRPRFRTYECRMRLIGTSSVTGRTLVPSNPFRIKENDARYVHESRFEGDLKP